MSPFPRSLPLLSRHLSSSSSSSATATATWHILRYHSPPPPLETALSNSLSNPPSPSLISSILSSSPFPSPSPSDLLLALRFFVWSALHPRLRLSSAAFSAASRSLLLPSHPHLFHLLLDSYLSDHAPVSLKTFKILLSLSHHSHLPFPLALSLLRRMPHFSIRPDIPLFNSLLRLPSAPSHAAVSLLQEMKLAELKPDMVTYVSVIKKLCTDGKFDDARMLLETMRADGCAPNVVVYSALLDGACGVGDIGAAVEILEAMEREEDKGCGPNVVSYTCLMKCFCENGKLEEALGVLERMGRNGCRPNRVTLKTLIKGFCDEGRVNDAYRIIEGMVGEEGSVSSNECYSVLVVCLLGVGDREGAEGFLRRMLVWGMSPDGMACNSLMREICKRRCFLDGYHWVGMLEENGVNCIDMDVYSRMLAGLCEEGHLVEAVKLGRRVVENGVRIEDYCVDSVVEAMEKIGEGDLASQIRRLKEGNDGLSVD